VGRRLRGHCGARYRKNDSTEGASRWALIRAQFADRDFSTFGWKTVLLGPSHFWVRVQYPATQEETLKRGGFALAFVGAAALALAIALKVNGPSSTKATRNSVRCSTPRRDA